MKLLSVCTMLAIDIETMGLLGKSSVLPEITCACLFDGSNEHKLLFYGIDVKNREKNIAILLDLLDKADQLIGFNAVLFDLEFIKQSFHVSEKQMSSWVRKTLDPFMFMKYALQQTASLAVLLESNCLPSKIGSGAHAITLASEVYHHDANLLKSSDLIIMITQGKLEELLDYCLMDAKLVFQLCHLSTMKCHGKASMKLDISSGKWYSLTKSKKTGNKIHFSDMRQVLPQDNLWNPEAVCWIEPE